MPPLLVTGALGLLAASGAGLYASSETGLSWLDQASRLGVVAFLILALYGLHRRWWVPGWTYRDLEERHAVLRTRFDKLVETALQSSRGIERTASIVEAALERAKDDRTA